MLEGTSVLIVDDVPEVVEVLSEFLRMQGLIVYEASNARNALSIIDRQKIDIAIVDVKLPDKSGISLLEEIRLRDPTIPVIMITGYFDSKIIVDSIKKGAFDFIPKPIEFEKLTLVLLRAKREKEILEEKMRIEQSMEDKKKIILLNRELQAKINELTTMYHISAKFNSVRIDEDVFEKTLEIMSEALDGRPVAYYLFQAEEAELVPLKIVGLSSVLSQRIALSSDFFSELISQRKFVKLHGVFFLPIMIKNRCIGFVGMECPQNGNSKLKESEIFLLKLMCEKASTVIENRMLYESLFENVMETLRSLIASINKRDSYTEGHCIRVANNAVRLAKYIGLSGTDLESLRLAAPVHDLGKIGISDSILLKPGRLTDEEFEIMKKHSTYGEEIISKFELLAYEARIIRFHHERFDGKGYPDNLSSNDIPYPARILAVCDSYDAMVSDRPYRRALSKEEAIGEIKRCKGSQFDPEIADAFIDLIEKEGWEV